MGGTVSYLLQCIQSLQIKPHFTDSSKAYSPASLETVSTFGFRGEGNQSKITKPVACADISPTALASMADLSCFEISSRTARSRESWSVIVKVFSFQDPSYRA